VLISTVVITPLLIDKLHPTSTGILIRLDLLRYPLIILRIWLSSLIIKASTRIYNSNFKPN
jgi:hypothetical protein